MTIIRDHGSFVRIMLPLHDDCHVDVLKGLFCLSFNLHIGTIYLKHKMYFADEVVYNFGSRKYS